MSCEVHLLPVSCLEFLESTSEPTSQGLDDWWRDYSKKCPWIFDGEITVCRDVVSNADHSHTITWQKGRYRQYMVRQDESVQIELVKVMYCSVAILSSDNSLLVCRASETTSSPGLVMLPGGNIELVDGVLSTQTVLYDAIREVKEEIGMDIGIDALDLWKLKTGGQHGDIGFIFRCRVTHSEGQIKEIFREHYAAEVAKDRSPEIRECIFLQSGNTPPNVNTVDYMDNVLEVVFHSI